MDNLLWVDNILFKNTQSKKEAIALASGDTTIPPGRVMNLYLYDFSFNGALVRRLKQEGILNPSNFNDG